MNRFFVVLCAAALAACATATPYQPAVGAQGAGYGYAEKRIEDNRYAITFNGNSLTERETVEGYLLYRAAELTLEQGYDYFIVAQRATDDNSRLMRYGGSSRYGFYPSYSWFSPRYGWHPFYDPLWGDDASYREVTRYEATAEIVLYKGQKPAADPQAFDARQVKENLGAGITRPTPG